MEEFSFAVKRRASAKDSHKMAGAASSYCQDADKSNCHLRHQQAVIRKHNMGSTRLLAAANVTIKSFRQPSPLDHLGICAPENFVMAAARFQGRIERVLQICGHSFLDAGAGQVA